MKDEIAAKLTETVGDAVPFFYSEAETVDYPYAVYELVSTPVMTKDGVHHINGDCDIAIYAEDLDSAATIADDVAQRIQKNMTEPFRAIKASYEEKCVSGVWIVEMNYKIKQYGRI